MIIYHKGHNFYRNESILFAWQLCVWKANKLDYCNRKHEGNSPCKELITCFPALNNWSSVHYSRKSHQFWQKLCLKCRNINQLKGTNKYKFKSHSSFIYAYRSYNAYMHIWHRNWNDFPKNLKAESCMNPGWIQHTILYNTGRFFQRPALSLKCFHNWVNVTSQYN